MRASLSLSALALTALASIAAGPVAAQGLGWGTGEVVQENPAGSNNAAQNPMAPGAQGSYETRQEQQQQAAPAPAAPQVPLGQLSPVVFVNGRAVTEWELNQRRRFLQVLNAPAQMIDGALNSLIDDRLRFDAAKKLNVSVSDDELKAAMGQFASRANLSTDQFVTELGRAGIAEQTFRDFVTAQLIWRDVVRARFESSTTFSKQEIEAAVDKIDNPADVPPGARVLISEIIVSKPADQDARAKLLIDRVDQLTRTKNDFSVNARQYSTASSRTDGGERDWLQQSALPPAVESAVARLKPGEISRPVHIQPGTWGMFMLRERKDAPKLLPKGVYALEFAKYLVPGGNSERALKTAQHIAARNDTCNALYGEAKGQPKGTLTVTTAASNQLPADIAGELSQLDPGEVSTRLVEGNARVLLMLCSRGKLLDDTTIPRAAVENRLKGEQMAQQAEAFMAQLKQDATIRYPQ